MSISEALDFNATYKKPRSRKNNMLSLNKRLITTSQKETTSQSELVVVNKGEDDSGGGNVVISTTGDRNSKKKLTKSTVGNNKNEEMNTDGSNSKPDAATWLQSYIGNDIEQSVKKPDKNNKQQKKPNLVRLHIVEVMLSVVVYY